MRVVHGGVKVQVDVRLLVLEIVDAREIVLSRILVASAAVVGEEVRVVLAHLAVSVVQRVVCIFADAPRVAEVVGVARAVALIDLHWLEEGPENVHRIGHLIPPLHILLFRRDAEGEFVVLVKGITAAHTVVFDRAVVAQGGLEVSVPIHAVLITALTGVDGQHLALRCPGAEIELS